MITPTTLGILGTADKGPSSSRPTVSVSTRRLRARRSGQNLALRAPGTSKPPLLRMEHLSCRLLTRSTSSGIWVATISTRKIDRRDHILATRQSWYTHESRERPLRYVH